MAHYSPEESFESLKTRTAQTVQNYFPIEGRQHTLHAKRVWVDDNKHVDDIRSQKDAKVKGRSWTVPIRAELELKDNLTGKVIDRQVVNVAQLPKITRRYSYIVNGSEWQVNNLFRMKSGVYTRVRKNGELTSQWNLAKGQGFDMDFSPKTQKMSLRYGESHIPLYPILKTMGVDDDSIERAWGKEIFGANKTWKTDEAALRQFYRSVKGTNPETLDDAKKLVHEEFGGTVLRPDSTQLTLGKPYDKVTGPALLNGSHKILRVSRQEVEPDDRDSLPFKELHSAEDLINERLEKWQVEKGVKRKIGNTLDKHAKIRDIINPDIFGKPLRQFFTSSVLSEHPTQTNPISFISGNRRTTLYAPGEGGISSTHQIGLEAQSINPSHLGFLDPIQTPESERIGVTLQLASQVVKDGHDLKIPVYNVKTGKKDMINPYQALKSNLAFPDQYEWKGGKPIPMKATVKVSDADGTVTVVKPSEVDYVLASSKGMFDLSANLIPFLQNNQGNRTMVASRQLEQAIALTHREKPLVQTRSDQPSRTFEQGIGEFVSHASPVAGVIEKVNKDSIIIKDKKGTRHEVQTYDDFPLNDDKSLLNSHPLVKAGDEVKAGQVIADTNFTRGGTLALGTNLRVAYMPWKGYNFEDGIVISQTAAKKLTSDHLFREGVTSEKSLQLDKKKFLSYMAGKVTKDQADKLDDTAVIREGQTVNKDDVLLGVLKEETVTQDEQKLGLFSKGLIRPWKPREIRWNKEVPGVVTKVVRHGKDITVFVKSDAPADVGDKIVGRHGNKGIITNIMPDHEMPHDKDGSPIEVILNPTGVPTRINLGQILETAASKIAEKTGKPYVVNNFDPNVPDYTRHLKGEMAAAGVSDTEDLFDPVTKRKFPNVLVGKQYILKLHHTAEKGLSVRSRDAYDSNMLPAGGGPKGGQTMDIMGMYALLAHNARENIREMQTYKCFLRRTMVETDQGPKMISAIVNQKLPVKVLSWDGLKFEYKKILNYWKREIDTPLVKVEYMARNSRGEYKRAVTKCTQGHKFYTTEGEVEAKDLEGKKLRSTGLMPDAHQLNVLYGSLLGDGCLTKGDHHFPAFSERHCLAQREYLEFKAAILADFSTRNVRDYCAGYEGFNVGQDMCEWSTLAQPMFEGLYRVFYLEGHKRVPKHVLLNPMIVAVWYQDDGSLTHGNRQRVVRISTGDFNEEDRNRLIDALKVEIGVTFTVCQNNSSHDLRLGTKEDIDKFFNYIAPYVHPSMAYKVDAPVGEALDRVMDEAEAQEYLVDVPVLRVTGYTDLTWNDGKYLYNLEVEGNHNYFANRVLVGNSDMNDDFWAQLQAGDSIPTPKTPFVFKKFEGYLKGMGLDVRKEGNDLILQPLTDKKVLEMSNGALADAGRALRAKDAKEEAGGIFDPKMTGGLKGKKWTHIALPERMPNPVFEGPISSLLGLNQNSYKRVVTGTEELGGKTGPQAIVSALADIDQKKMRKDIEQKLPDLRTTKLNDANKKLKYLRALDTAGMNPSEAYTMKHMPVLPPVFRPITILDSGDINYDDVNRLYNHIGMINLKYKDYDPALPKEEKLPLQTSLYDGLKAVMLTGHIHQGRHRNAIMQTISGSGGEGGQPKEGFFQDKVIGRRQDLSMRGVIIPEPSLSLDEVGLPRKAAAELYKPFVVRRLVQMGQKPLDAQEMVKKNHPAALEALQNVLEERPILLKRDPVLHRFGVQAFRPRLVEGKAVKIHPLATSGYNADFDGDKMSAFVPVSQKAVKEAYKMMPSFNLFNPTTGHLMSKPSQESMMGIYKLTEVDKKTSMRFATAGDAARAVKDGKVGMTDLISLDNIEGDAYAELLKKSAQPIKTTVGRLMLYHSLPEEVRDHKLLTDQSYLLNKGNLYGLLTDVARKTPKDFGLVSDKFKDIGNEYATGMSIGLDDFLSDHVHRDVVLKDAAKKEHEIRGRVSSPTKRKDEIVNLYVGAAEKIHAEAKKSADGRKNRMYDWVKSGARGSWSQFKQMTVAPMLVADSKGEPVPIPIPKSYSEGLDIGSYFASMHGARMGTIGRVQGTQAPGKMSKQLINTTMSQMVIDEDCGATKGVVLPIDNRDVLDRFTVREIDLGNKAGNDKGKIPAGSLVTSDMLSRLKNNKVNKIEVRSPLKCAHGKGLCAKCYGLNEDGQLHSPGSNVGVIAAQALGEPATQLAMNAFHTGGIVGAKGTNATSLFNRLEQLLNVPKKLPGSATLADTDGTVSAIEKDPAGGWRVHVSGKDHYVPASRTLTVKKGDEVKMGDSISDGPKNPREMLARTNMNAVQQYLTDEIWNSYKDEGPVRRRNVETFVRAMTNLSEVTDAGFHETLLRGDHAATSEVVAFNRNLKPGQKPVQYKPILQGINMLPLELQTDWLARLQSKNLKDTILDAAAEGWKSSLHSTHPIPSMAYGKEFGTGTDKAPWLY